MIRGVVMKMKAICFGVLFILLFFISIDSVSAYTYSIDGNSHGIEFFLGTSETTFRIELKSSSATVNLYIMTEDEYNNEYLSLFGDPETDWKKEGFTDRKSVV